MKKLLFGLIATVLFGNLSFGQSEQNKLRDDNDFIELVLEMNNFKKFIESTISEQKLSLDDVTKQLNDLNNKNLDYDTQMTEVNKIFKRSVSNQYINHMEIFNSKWNLINKKFANIDSKYLEDEYLAVLNKIGSVSVSGVVECGWRYNLFIAAAGAAVVLCHGGCDTTALATTAGLGIPVCVWACGTILVATGVLCYDNYCL